MKTLLMFILPAALYAQTCTIVNSASCPQTGSPTAGDQFGDTVSWTSSPANVFAAPNGGEDFQAFLSGEGTAFVTDIQTYFAQHPSNNILYAGQFTPLNQDFFLSDPMTCPAAGPPTCLFNNVPYAEAFADSLFKPLGNGGLGLGATDINLDPGPWFASSQYANYCAAYSSNTVAAGTACFTPPTGPIDYQSYLTSALNTYTTVLNYIMKTYPQVKIHFSPTPSADIWATCGLAGIASRTEPAVEACMVPLYQAIVATVKTTRFTALHEAAGGWGLFCGAGCPFLAKTTNVDIFLQNASIAIKTVSPSTAVGVGGAFSEMGLVDGIYVCPNSNGSLNYWCDYTTIDPFLDYVGMDIYPDASATSAEYASLVGTPLPEIGTYTYMALQANNAPYSLGLWVNESSTERWSPPGGGPGTGESDTYLGSGWIGWTTTDSDSGWLSSVPTAWAQSLGVQGWDYFDASALLYSSTDPNNTHAEPNTDNYMAMCMASLPGVSAFGTLYGSTAKAALAPFDIKSSAAGQIGPLAPGSIVSIYGANLANVTLGATTLPVPTSLAGNSVQVTDSNGTTRAALLFYVSSTQVNFEIPLGTVPGIATVEVENAAGTTQSASLLIGTISPGLYTVNSSGLAAAWVLPVLSGVQQPLLPDYKMVSGSAVASPINLAVANEQVYLELFGTGIRSATTVTAKVGGVSVPVLFAGPSGYEGEDQVNIGPLPTSLEGAGSVNIMITANGKLANVVNVTIQ